MRSTGIHIRKRALGLLVLSVLISALALAACSGDGGGASDELKASVVENYAAGAHASYVRSLNSAITLDAAIDKFPRCPVAA